LTDKLLKEQNKMNRYCHGYFDNVIFIGRVTSDMFFIKDVLIDTFRKLKNTDF